MTNTTFKSLYFLLFLFYFISSCDVKKKENTLLKDNVKKQKSSLSEDEQKLLDKIKGGWILKDFMEKIYLEKSARSALLSNEIAHRALFLEVTDSSFLFSGTIFPEKEKKIQRLSKDSLLQVKTLKHTFHLVITSKNQLLFINQEDGTKKHLREITHVEERFLKKDKNAYSPFEKGFTTLISNHIFKGEFISQDSDTIVIDSMMKVKGFRDYYKCKIDNWFGTLHWMQKDMIYFYRKDKEPPHDIDTWTWKYKKNTLILKKVEGVENKMKETNQTVILKKML